MTGESRTKSLKEGQTTLAGMINIQKIVDIQVNRSFNESSLAAYLT
ncbi:MAG: hypothetical protein ACMUEL_02815 [Flavobacteriales bacterium Tduv]